MKIILDSTAYRADILLKGNAFRVFLPALTRIGASLVVPTVVFEEVVNGFREQVEAHVDAIRKLRDEARHLGLSMPVDMYSDERVKEEVVKYRKYLAATLNSETVEIPNLSHAELVTRALARRKPFNERGAGYRDALIWETVIRAMKDSETDACFVTANTHDFWREDGLHPDLAKELQERGIARGRFQLYKKLEDLNAKLIVPKLKHLEGIYGQVQADTWGNFKLKDWILNNLGDTMRRQNVETHLSQAAASGSVVHGPVIKEVKGVLVDDVREIPGGNILLGATTQLVVELVIGERGEDHYDQTWPEIREYPGFWGFGYKEQKVDVEAEFSLVIDPKTQQVISSQIDEVEEESEAGRSFLNPHVRRG